jgi:hypothetical protein
MKGELSMMFWKSLISSFLRYQVKCSSGKVITFFFFHWFCLEFHLTMMYLQSSMLFLSNRAFIKNSKMESGLLQVYEGISKQLSMFCSNYIQELVDVSIWKYRRLHTLISSTFWTYFEPNLPANFNCSMSQDFKLY